MSKGFCILAQNSEVNYVKQAYACAVSIVKNMPDAKITLITNDNIEEKYKAPFDQIVPIPWNDQAKESDWKIENRWKIYHASPYEKTIVLDADIVFVNDVSHWWNELKKYKLFFVSNVYSYRDELVTTNKYRKAFIANDLPNLYSGIHYFEKSDFAKQFYTMLEIVVTNWQMFYGKFAPEHYQDWCSIDLCAAITAKLLDISGEITNPNSFITFTHMKTHAQHWQDIPNKWTRVLGKYLRPDGTFLLGNFVQNKPLHYVEPEFLTDEMLTALEKL